MAVYLWVELVCVACARTTSGRMVSGVPPKREMLMEAKREGWIITRKESFCSSQCRDESGKPINTSGVHIE